MGQTLVNITFDRYERNLSVSDLNNLYTETVEELHRLSLIVPSGSIDDGELIISRTGLTTRPALTR